MEVVVLDPPVSNRRGLPDRGDCALGRSQGDPGAHFRVQEGAQAGEEVVPRGPRPGLDAQALSARSADALVQRMRSFMR